MRLTPSVVKQLYFLSDLRKDPSQTNLQAQNHQCFPALIMKFKSKTSLINVSSSYRFGAHNVTGLQDVLAQTKTSITH
uniref:MSP domain-containing protein n=1 Tax=Tetranychus urticae TaxID=32264 RepID=T1JS88_TETUR